MMFAHNLIPFPFFRQLNAYDLLIFALGSMVIISILNFYYNRIPKSNSSKDELKTPIYDSKDILLQSNSLDANFIIPEKTTSTFVKVFVFILIALVAFTPLYQLLGVEHFL
ncbi:hypothetical protein [Polaribacter aestuariivivens]|uniref:hypothetical protein n=1 Tax=Polaribacter aestuariivivens TaxID=2304626 RepID=UPI003F49A9F6